jgi:hypothetical protein
MQIVFEYPHKENVAQGHGQFLNEQNIRLYVHEMSSFKLYKFHSYFWDVEVE